MSASATLRLVAPDQRGLVAAVSDWLFRHHGNILHADQHVDDDEGLFLQRVAWSLDGFSLSRDAIGEAFAPVATRLGMDWALTFSDDRERLAVLVSRQPHCLYDLLARWRSGQLRAEIVVVVSNHADLAHVARRFDVPFAHIPVTADTKDAAEEQLTEVLTAHDVETVVLARYMQILSDAFVAGWPQRILNIHHSFLPAFKGGRPYHRAHARGVKLIGATAHYVTADLDEGPIVAQDVTPVSHRHSVRDLVDLGRDLEKVVLARAVQLHLAHRVFVVGGKTVVF